MAFDTQTRNRLARLVADCRDLLTVEFDAKLQEFYGIYANEGRVLAIDKLVHLDDERLHIARLLRERIEHIMATDASGGVEGAVNRVLREQAFTILNRFAAIRMAEERGIMVESVGGGLNSKAFKMFSEVAFSGLGDAYSRYRAFLRCTFDELATDLGALFDRRSPYGLLFPRQDVLLKLFDILNASDLKHLWSEDETIGWVYQYYNDPNERKKMREESSSPRSSRELAVRNQFFTPRYIVEFLTDNTLGRLWYEMTQGETQLKRQCRHLVRRPKEMFLNADESLPVNDAGDGARAGENLSHEELLRQPVYILHRSLKDPREIRLLDPACGSMHFGLYAFDLFAVIYDEAWEIAHGPNETAKSSENFAPFVDFATTFSEKAAFLREVPRLIVEHNIHGIDIDPRAAQIAGLSLWLRAQRAWHQVGVKPADRPYITRSNLVCAEPMPGEKELLLEFVEQQFPAGERSAFAFLLEKIFDRMTLAGEAGSLLCIEDEIRTDIADTKRLWREGPRLEQASLLYETGEKADQGEMHLDLSGITDEQFWERAEQRIYNALETYAEQAESGGGFQRRLFADDAAQGFAFIDLCRKRYDVVVMNPPFGEASKGAKEYIGTTFKRTKNDLYAVFVERSLGYLNENGAIGAITSRSGFFLGSFDRWREELILTEVQPSVLADLGEGVLDAAMVETAAYCLHKRPSSQAVFFRLLTEDRKDVALQREISNLVAGTIHSESVFCVNPASFRQVPGAPFAYWAPTSVLALFKELPALENEDRRVGLGLSTKNDMRFVRANWEVRPELIARNKRWSNYANGSNAVPFYWDHSTIVLSEGNFAELRAYLLVKFPYLNGNASWILHEENDYQAPVIGWPLRSLRFSPQAIPPGFVFSARTYALLSPDIEELKILLPFLSSKLVHYLLSLKLGASGRPEYVTATVRELPVPRLDADEMLLLRKLGSALFRSYQSIAAFDETSKLFISPAAFTANQEQLTKLSELHTQVDETVYGAYGISSEERTAINTQTEVLRFNLGAADDDASDPQDSRLDDACSFRTVLAYGLGCVFGRWDIRYATGERPTPHLPDPFAPLPMCPPGMLQGEDGLPLSPDVGRRLRAEGRYPLDVAWDGILVDDPEHPLDLERRVHAVLAVLWADRAETLEPNVCVLLGVPTLRDWFRRPNGFFADHLKRYSKSRRQAPIYWPLSTASGSYTLWIYYHRLTDQTLFHCVNNFVKPKIAEIEGDLSRAMTGGGDERTKRNAIEQLTSLRAELVEFRDELLRIGQLPYKPNLNDGALITAAPLWKLFRLSKWQKALKECWEELSIGRYDWAHLALTLWPQRVKKSCEDDYSLAIAHGLQSDCKAKIPLKKVKASAETSLGKME